MHEHTAALRQARRLDAYLWHFHPGMIYLGILLRHVRVALRCRHVRVALRCRHVRVALRCRHVRVALRCRHVRVALRCRHVRVALGVRATIILPHHNITQTSDLNTSLAHPRKKTFFMLTKLRLCFLRLDS
jgi:hypothetical protein